MSQDRQQIIETISLLFESQKVGVLSTQKDRQPYASLIAFSVSDDLENLYFLTPDTTRKYDYLVSNPQVAILVNDSKNRADDIYNCVSVTGTGVAVVLQKAAAKKQLHSFLEKHPHLKSFSDALDTAFICIQMKQYVMVNQFQNVVSIDIGS